MKTGRDRKRTGKWTEKKQAYVLRHVNDMTVPELAAKTHMSTSVVRSRLRRLGIKKGNPVMPYRGTEEKKTIGFWLTENSIEYLRQFRNRSAWLESIIQQMIARDGWTPTEQ